MAPKIPPLSETSAAHMIGISQSSLLNSSEPCVPGSPCDDQSSPALLAYASAETRDLRAEVERLRADRDRLADVQRKVMELIGAHSPDRLLHDLRNILNERELFKALADTLDG